MKIYVSLDVKKKEMSRKPCSGKFNVRLSPELHRQVAILAKKKHLSLNGFVEKALTD